MEEELRGCYGHSTVGEGRVVGAELKEAMEDQVLQHLPCLCKHRLVHWVRWEATGRF